MKILVFVEGTLFASENAVGLAREEMVALSQVGQMSVADAPIGNAAAKLQTWKRQGAEILYLTFRKKPEDIAQLENTLGALGLPAGQLLFRRAAESYGEVAARAQPDIIVEDDCESIGGAIEMTYPQLPPELKPRIRSVVVKEFAGIDALPDSILELAR